MAFKLGPEHRDRYKERLMSELARSPEPEPQLLMTSALFFYLLGNPAKAEQQADQLLELLPRNINGLLLKCMIFEQTGRKMQAIELLRNRQESIRKLNSQSWRVIEKLATLLKQEEGEQSAVEFLDQWREDDRFKASEESFEAQWAHLRQQVLQSSP